MAQDYREIYQELLENVDRTVFLDGYPTIVDDLLMDAGIEVFGHDPIKVTHSALFVYFAQKINDLERQIEDLEKSQETKR